MLHIPDSSRVSSYIGTSLLLAALFWVDSAAAQTVSQLVYVALDQPCRIVETRKAYNPTQTGGMLTAKSVYTYGVDDISIRIQTGNTSASCGIDANAQAVAASILILDATDSGDLRAWADSTRTPSAASIAVFNPDLGSVAILNGAFTNLSLYNQRFDVRADHANVDLVIDVQGYWRALSWNATVSGAGAVALGTQTTASGTTATAMGYGSTAAGVSSTAIGANTSAGGDYSTAMGDSTSASAEGATAMGHASVASGNYATAMGQNTTASSLGAFASGYYAKASGSASFAAGNGTTASGSNSMAVGYGAKATGTESVAMGNATTASGASSTALGAYTTASNAVSTALGYYTTADGIASTAMGYAAITNGYSYSFVYGDGSATTANSADNQFMVRASGGFVFYTSSGSAGVFLPAGSGSWSSSSDRNAKDELQPVDPRDVLARVVAMPLSTWHYKAQDHGYRHMGPMAQDFHAAFQLGEADTSIDNVDADGVALAAIQGLNALLDEKDTEIEALRRQLVQQHMHTQAELAALRSQLNAQQSRLGAFEADSKGGVAENGMSSAPIARTALPLR